MKTKLEKVCERLGIRVVVAEYGGVELPDDWARDAHPWKVTLGFGRRRLTVPFFQGSAHTQEPSAADVISCLVSDASAGDQTFEEFCSEFGYDVDSRKAEATFRACAKMAPRIRRFLYDSFAEVAGAEH
jgi:hypothetical protein